MQDMTITAETLRRERKLPPGAAIVKKLGFGEGYDVRFLVEQDFASNLTFEGTSPQGSPASDYSP